MNKSALCRKEHQLIKQCFYEEGNRPIMAEVARHSWHVWAHHHRLILAQLANKKNWRQKHLHSNKRMWSFAQQPINAFTGSFGRRNMVHLYEAPDGLLPRSLAVCSYFKLLKKSIFAPILATAVHPHYHLGRHLHIGNSISTRHFQMAISREREKMLPDKI